MLPATNYEPSLGRREKLPPKLGRFTLNPVIPPSYFIHSEWKSKCGGTDFEEVDQQNFGS